ncbi:uncharacterized protein LOC114340796 [Diabrotica virgifera virgifera]|uniref:Tc1-like transposase DDE domain-containing protein n=1 Tax=Diabrotica virgifera virgifera TaxID=50390 RepID=A0ABM5LAP3_DIAVI|nr:uncharacterized protein LOC114340796 [Diabrotica virgifera virgifera]
MYKLVVLFAVLAAVSARPSHLLTPVVHSAAVIGSVPTSISEHSTSIVHNHALVHAAPVVHSAPLIHTVHAAPVFQAYSSPVVVASPYLSAGHLCAKYCDLLNGFLLETAHVLYPEGWRFQQDNARCHTCAYTQAWIQEHELATILWPAASPDFSPIENIWGLMKTEVEQAAPRDKKFSSVSLKPRNTDLLVKMFKLVVLFALVAITVAKPSGLLLSSPLVETYSAPLVAAVPAAVSSTYRKDIISKPVVAAYSAPAIYAEPLVEKYIAPVALPAAVSHSYRSDLVSSPVVAAYAAHYPALAYSAQVW